MCITVFIWLDTLSEHCFTFCLLSPSVTLTDFAPQISGVKSYRFKVNIMRQSDRQLVHFIWVQGYKEWQGVKWQPGEGEQRLGNTWKLSWVQLYANTVWCIVVMDRWRAELRSYAVKMLLILIYQKSENSWWFIINNTLVCNFNINVCLI